MKGKKIIISLIITLIVICFLWIELGLKEVNLLALECAEQSKSVKFFKITKRIFEDRPYKLYISNPDYDRKGSPPVSIGVSKESAKESEKTALKYQKYFLPDWYTFIQEDRKNEKDWVLPVAYYINRVTLQMEVWGIDEDLEKFLGVHQPWAIRNCSIVQLSEFERDWKRQIENKKKEQKF